MKTNENNILRSHIPRKAFNLIFFIVSYAYRPPLPTFSSDIRMNGHHQMVVRPYRQYQSISNVDGKKANADDGDKDDDNGCRSKTQPKAKGGAKKTICSKKG